MHWGDEYGRALLVPGATPTLPVESRGQPVCSCFNVTDLTIAKHLAACPGTAGERLASLQAALKCGTNCGSCLPQVRGMVGRELWCGPAPGASRQMTLL